MKTKTNSDAVTVTAFNENGGGYVTPKAVLFNIQPEGVLCGSVLHEGFNHTGESDI